MLKQNAKAYNYDAAIIRFHPDLVVKVKIGGKDVCFESATA